MIFVGAIHLIFCFEKARRTDAGTPEKISIHSQGTLHDPTTRFTLEDMRGFSPAFRNLLGYRNKGYVSLMHVQAQFGQQHSNAYESSTDEDSHVTMGGLQCCTECEHHPIKPLRSLHCHVCDQDTILSDGHSCKQYLQAVYSRERIQFHERAFCPQFLTRYYLYRSRGQLHWNQQSQVLPDALEHLHLAHGHGNLPSQFARLANRRCHG